MGGEDVEGTFRSFVDLEDERHNKEKSPVVASDTASKLGRLREGVIGDKMLFDGPFGERPILYADWTASGRAYAPIESFLQKKVYPLYANTHTSTSVSGLQSTCFRDEARQIIQQAVNGNTRTDVVLFTGSGATSAVNKMVHVLGLNVPLAPGSKAELRPVVLVGPFEHHSNLLPWRESCAEVVTVRENDKGTGLDKKHLASLLANFKDRPLVIGSFSAASNVTGVIEDVDQVTALLHRHGALSFWDYAAAAPYTAIDMNPVLAGDHPDRAFVHKDAVFISPHKFVGGVNSPGVLVAKKRLFQNAVPADGSVGGGTVYFVKDGSHRFLSNRVEREEGGTPDVIGAIRAGLAFQLKQSIGAAAISQADKELVEKIQQTLGAHPRIALFGPVEISENRLPIVSFLIRHGPPESGLFLHYNFVSAVLNDLYGIQSRGGCMCAGPYAQRLLGMSPAAINAIEAELVRDSKRCEYLRPGFTRFSLAYFSDPAQVDFILQAVCDVADAAWKLCPLYRFNQRTGEWKHKSRFTKFPGRVWLDDADLFSEVSSSQEAVKASVSYEDLLLQGKKIMSTSAASKETLGDQTTLLGDSAAPLRWFLLPSEALEELKNGRAPSAPWKSVQADQWAVETEIGQRLDGPVVEPRAYWDKIRKEGTIDRATIESIDSQAAKRPSVEQSSLSDEDIKKEPKRTRVEEDPSGQEQEQLALPIKANGGGNVICEDNSCFKVRAKDKFPLRDATVTEPITPALVVEAGSADLVKQIEMDGAKLFPKPPKSILRGVGRAIAEWDMIKEGDKLLLGLSGGKDSLCLLHILLDLKKRAPVKFELAACTIDPMTEAFDPSPLIPYMKALGVPYFYQKDPIFDKAKSGSLQGTSICSFCARMKRGALYTCARKNGYNTLVLAQHLDDLAETALMGMLHNGHMRSMMANYTEKQGDIKVIRPLVYVREKETKDFSYKAKLPVINENCPACFEAPQERRRIKKLLATEEANCPSIFSNMRRALVPLMDPEVLDTLSKSTLEREAKGKGNKKPKRKRDDASN